MSKSLQQQLNCLKTAEANAVLVVFDNVLCEVRA